MRLAGLAEGEWLTVAELARSETMPRKYLERILLALNRGGLVISAAKTVWAATGWPLLAPAANAASNCASLILD